MASFKTLKGLLKDFTVLYVEDDKHHQKQIELFLNNLFSQVVVSDNGKEALKLSRNIKPDLLITNLAMPKIGGLELVRAIRSVNPMLEILIISGHFEVDQLIESFHLGVSDFIKKPVDMAVLESALFRVGENISLKNQLSAYRKNEIDKESNITNILKILEKDRVQVDLVNFYKGVPIINHGLIKNVSANFIEIQTRELQNLIIKKENHTYIESYLLKKPIKASLYKLDSYSQDAKFTNFSLCPFSMLRRNYIRLQPDDNFVLNINKNDRDYIVKLLEISPHYLTFSVINSDLFEHFEKEDLLHVQVSFYVLKQKHTLKFQTKVKEFYKQKDNNYSYVCKWNLNTKDIELINNYLFNREIEIVEELKVLIKHSSISG